MTGCVDPGYAPSPYKPEPALLEIAVKFRTSAREASALIKVSMVCAQVERGYVNPAA